jgi:hypothetical protein
VIATNKRATIAKYNRRGRNDVAMNKKNGESSDSP